MLLWVAISSSIVLWTHHTIVTNYGLNYTYFVTAFLTVNILKLNEFVK